MFKRLLKKLGWVSGPTKESKLMNSDHSRPLLTAIKVLINTNTGEEASKIIQQHPELLSEEADKVFEALIEQSESEKVRTVLQSYRQALQQLRQARKNNEGIPLQPLLTAIQTLINTNTDEEAIKTIQQHPELLSEEADKVFEALIAQPKSKEIRTILQFHRQALQQVRQARKNEGIPADRLQPLLSAIQTLISSKSATGEEATKTIQQHPELLSEEADKVFEALIEQQESDEARALLRFYRQVLQQVRQARKNGLFQAERLLTTTLTLVNSKTVEELEKTIQQHPELLSEEADKIFEALIEQQESDEARSRLQLCRQGLQELRQARKNEGIPPHFQADVAQAQSAQARYLQHNDPTGLDDSITAWQRILQHPDFTTVDADFRLGVLNDSAGTYLRRYGARGEISDLDHALSGLQVVVSQTPAGSPHLPRGLSNLGNGLSDRYARTSDLTDLQAGIEAYQRAVQLTPAGSPDLPTLLSNLSTGLRDRYVRTGDLTDLQAGIEACQRVMQLTPAGSPDLPRNLNNLGNGLMDRYARTGDLTDLQAVIENYQQAVSQTPAGAPDLPSLLSNLGVGLSKRYARTGDLTDLQAGIEAFQRAVQLIPAGSIELPRKLNNLGIGLITRYQRTGNLTDLQAGIEAYQRSVQLTPANSPDLPGILHNLGKGLSKRYARTGDLTDLQAWIEASQRAVQLTPAGAPELPIRLNGLGSGFQDRYTCTGDLTDLQAGLENYQRAAQRGLEINLEESLTSASNWLRWAFGREAWEEVGSAYQFAYQASTRLVQTQLQRADQESWLKETQGLAAQTAYAYAKRQRWKNAVVILERGLAQLLSQALARDRAKLNNLTLTAAGKQLSARYQQTTQAWRLAQTKDTPSPDELRNCRAAFEQVVKAIRQVKGYEKFLQAPTWEDIKVAATETPLVYLLTTSAGGLALIVHQQTVTSVALPKFTEEGLTREVNSYFDAYQKQRQNHEAWHQAIDNMGQWLWQVLWQPLRKVLLPNQQHITLIPVGWLNLLPLHAAWTADTTKPTGRRYALDEVTIAYAPNAVSLQKARDLATHISSDKLLAIDEPKPVKANPLPSSSIEVNAIARHFTQPQLLRHQAATQETVKKALSLNYTVLHFSCHGGANRAKPLETGLLMANNEMLTVQQFLDTKLQARLVTLSACETGIIGTKNIEEVVGLPASLLQAGVAGVAASLWPVAELTTMLLMTQFYQRWRHEYPDNPAEALRQAQQWVRDSKPRQKTEFLRTILPETAAKELREKMGVANYAHPYYWAAFTYVGV